MKRTNARGQASVEFFLVLAFSFVLAAALLTQADQQLREFSSLQKAAVTTSGLDSLAAWVNSVQLQGNGAQVTGRIFIPQGSVCPTLNASFPVAGPQATTVFQCDADPLILGRTYSRELLTNSIDLSGCLPTTQVGQFGWYRVKVVNSAGNIVITCTKES